MVRFTERAGIVPELGRREAERLHQYYIGPEHLLLGLLRDAEDPLGTDLYPEERRRNAYLGLPTSGTHPVRLLVEARGLTVEALKAAVLRELDRAADGGPGRLRR
jgi:Clp amino terminal domain, pathogenicity island component